MHRHTPVLAGFMLIAVAAHPQATTDELARCAAKRTAALRLQCETLAKQKLAAQVVPATGQVGRWTVFRETDPITDQKGVTFTLAADDADVLGLPGLVIRCKRGDLNLYLATGEYLGKYNDDIKVRLGTLPATDDRWPLSSDQTALFHPGGRSEIEAFIRNLTLFDRVAFQVTPYQKEPMAIVLTLSGIAQVSQELFAICPPTPETGVTETTTVFLSVPPATQVFNESVVEERPEILSGPQLQYPDLLRHARIEGRVLVQAIIDTTGRAEPQSIKVIQSPNPGFDQSAKGFVLGAMFRPARIHGRAVRVLISLPIDFKIK